MRGDLNHTWRIHAVVRQHDAGTVTEPVAGWIVVGELSAGIVEDVKEITLDLELYALF